MFLLSIYLFIALFFSFLCSILEAVILSITPSYIGIKLEDNKKLGEELQKLKDDIDRPLAAILTLNTFAHTIGAAGVGAQAQNIWGNEYLSIISIILTLLILFFSEIIPKTLGANYWEQLAPYATPVLKAMIAVLYPLVLVSQFLTKLLKKEKDKSIFTRADFSALTEIGLKSGVFKKEESKIIQNLIRFNKVLVKSIMTPRTVVLAADEEMTIKEFFEANKNLRFSRIPVYSNNIDNVTGFILKNKVLAGMIEKQENVKLKDIKREISVVYEQMQVPELFQFLMEKNEQIALVVDEFGGMQGVVTVEDIMETLLGMEIIDELDSHADLQMLARKSWERRAAALGLLKKEDK